MLRKLHHNPLASRQCVSCPPAAPTCNCSSGQSCILTSQSCSSCAVAACVTNQIHAPSSGTNKGALAGAVVGVLIFLLIVIGGFLWWRRRPSMRSTVTSNREKAAGSSPGFATANGAPTVVVRAPDAIEKGTNPENGEIDPNPFTDAASNRSGQSIPIAFEGNSLHPHATSPTGTTFTAPARPHRSPDLTLRDGSNYFDRPTSSLEPPRPGYAPSQRSGFTVSTMDSTASSAMAALYDSPTIVSAGSRQVLGAVRAEVVQVGGLSPNGTLQPMHQQQRRSQPGPSPLSLTHSAGRFPTIEEDPFSDESKRNRDSSSTDLTFGMGSATVSTSRNIARSGAEHGRDPAADSDHSLTRSSLTETQNDHATSIYGSASRRTSQDSVLSSSSRTDSVLANFPFVPPSPLPSSRNRSPLSVVFSNDRQSTSLAHIAEANSHTNAPPLPTHHNVAEMNRSNNNLVPPSISPSGVSPTETDPLQPPYQRVVSTVSRASTSSTGLDAFHFQFAPEGEPPLPLPNPAFYNDNAPRDSLNAPTTPVERQDDDLTSLHYDSNASNSDLPRPPNQKQTRASLDTLELSRDLTANRLSYD